MNRFLILLFFISSLASADTQLNISWPTQKQDDSAFDYSTEGKYFSVYCGDNHNSLTLVETEIAITSNPQNYTVVGRNYGYCKATITDTHSQEGLLSNFGARIAPPTGFNLGWE